MATEHHAYVRAAVLIPLPGSLARGNCLRKGTDGGSGLSLSNVHADVRSVMRKSCPGAASDPPRRRGRSIHGAQLWTPVGRSSLGGAGTDCSDFGWVTRPPHFCSRCPGVHERTPSQGVTRPQLASDTGRRAGAADERRDGSADIHRRAAGDAGVRLAGTCADDRACAPASSGARRGRRLLHTSSSVRRTWRTARPTPVGSPSHRTLFPGAPLEDCSEVSFQIP